MNDPVMHPKHYAVGRFGVETIEFTRLMPFCAGNAVKYIWRHLDKGNPVQDLEKARVYAYWAWESLQAVALPGQRDTLSVLYYRHFAPHVITDPAASIIGHIVFEEWSEVIGEIDQLLTEYRGASA